jgi:hypothetical protein
LGAPVVPLVKRRTAMSSGSSGAAGASLAARALARKTSRETTDVPAAAANDAARSGSVTSFAGAIRSRRASSSPPVSR